ncbi:hypothetical protein KCU67_g9241, partial [Aureobasidium melanogenum]
HHGFASYSAVTKMEPSDDYPRLSLPGMPTEILSAIVNLASPATLPALRLTNKRLCAVSNKPFAIKHFCERRHVASAYSMDALIEITGHPFFGKFVKTVVISGSRPELDKNLFLKGVVRSCVQCPRPNPRCKNPAPRHVALDFIQLRGKLEKTFSNSDAIRYLSWVFRSPTIRALTLHGVSFYTEQFDTNLWSSVLDRLARTAHLKRLEMLRCRYSFPEAENEAIDPFMRRPWIQLPSGVYELKKPLRWGSEFILAPSGDVNEAIILTDQTSISGQLKALADRVAQMELDKIAEIERDGYVRTDIVGVSKKSQSEEDVIEHGSMEDDGSEEADNERGEREENDDQDEHEHTVELSEI